MRLSVRISSLTESPTLAIGAKTRELKSRGIDVLSFSAGEPDFDTPAAIKDAAIQALRDGFTKYTDSNGMPELRKAIAEKLQSENDIPCEPSQVLVSIGAKHSLFNVFQVLCDESDEVLLPAPYWVSYPEQIRSTGASVVVIPTSEASGFKVTRADLERYASTRTKALVLCSPSNPTGVVYTKEDLQTVADFCVARGIFVIADEIYEKLVYGGAVHHSISSLGPKIRDLAVTVNGFSKTYAMTGWRLGYAVGPKPIMEAAANFQSHVTSNATSFAQKGALVALKTPNDFLGQMVAEYDRRRRYCVERLNAMPGVSCVTPEGAFYVFPNISGLFGKTSGGRRLTNSMEVAEALLEQARVGVVPGLAFGDDRCMRLSYATGMKQIEEGMNRIEAWVRGI
ncbi:MAG: pyridoxal phosphate-dependent aminotransferase [Planctomycetes bacterium]|nr:pyridoxal phosphate-dependent aminotransferase [Planctomycetota bacterium]